MKKLSGLQIRKALELEVPVEKIFRIDIKEEGDRAAMEIYEDEISHTSEIENVKEIFGDDPFVYYASQKRGYKVNDNLKAYTFQMYMAHIQEDDVNIDSKIISDKSEEIIFLNTKVLNYDEYMRNLMDAQMFLGKYGKNIYKRKFSGIGSFKMEEYAEHHSLINHSSLHMLDFYVKDSNIFSTIGRLVTAGYEQDIVEQREYMTEDEYQKLLDTVKKHKDLIKMGINLNLK